MPAAIGTALLAETALAGTTIFGVTTATVVGYAVISGAFLALQQAQQRRRIEDIAFSHPINPCQHPRAGRRSVHSQG